MLQAIKGAAGVGVPHDDPSVVVTKKPIGGGGDPVRPPSVAVNGLGAGTGIGECRHLNGLLVECRTMVIGAAASDGGDREMALSGLAVEQPFQEVQAAPQEDRTLERRAGRDHRFGEGGVGVGEARLGPRPSGMPARVWSSHRRHRRAEQRAQTCRRDRR